MEYVEGGRDLAGEMGRLRRDSTSMPAERALHILCQILDGLRAAHAAGIVHRDIKPANILLQRVPGNDDHVRICDFGLARFLDQQTRTSVAMGTPAYLAPEQVTGGRVGPWTDLYAVAIMACELLLSRRPFAGETAEDVLAQKLDRERIPLADVPADGSLLGLLRAMLARDPEQRPLDAGAVRARLIDAVGEPQVSSSCARLPDEPTEYLPERAPSRRAQRGRRRVALVLASSLLAVATVLFMLLPQGSTEGPPPTATLTEDSLPPVPLPIASSPDVHEPEPVAAGEPVLAGEDHRAAEPDAGAPGAPEDAAVPAGDADDLEEPPSSPRRQRPAKARREVAKPRTPSPTPTRDAPSSPAESVNSRGKPVGEPPALLRTLLDSSRRPIRRRPSPMPPKSKPTEERSAFDEFLGR